MRRIILPGTGVTTSRLIFGTASLLKISSARERQNLISAAIEHGFTHFDTAPLYGFGHAERMLAPMLRRRPEVTVTSKVGLYPPGGESQSLFSAVLRKSSGRFIPSLSRPVVNWCVERARNALTGSLERLGRDHIDLYTLHEPVAELLNTDEWQSWLEAERDAGRITAFGISADADRTSRMLRCNGGLLDVVQTADSLAGREADQLESAGRPMQITYGYLSAAARLGPFDAKGVIRAALQRNRLGAIIVSTRIRERLSVFEELCADEPT